MNLRPTDPWNRRQFLLSLGAATALSRCGGSRPQAVSLIVDPEDPVASSPPGGWALQQLQESLGRHPLEIRRHPELAGAPPGDLCIVAAGSASPAARQILEGAGASPPAGPESLALVSGTLSGRPVLLACGADVRGLVYALLELSDRLRHTRAPLDALQMERPLVESPANAVRSVARLFVSDVEDKPWFYDREMWAEYLTLLATQRFNRFQLSLGIGYDFLNQVTDAYFLFAYPFLVSVPGYDVRAVPLSQAERRQNLETLQFISEQTAARGLHFQLGIWMHGYQWIDSSHPNYTIEGLPPEKHAEYCRDALTTLLDACPAIRGVTFRIHGESGINEGSYSFWKTVFDGVVRSGREVEIDMHAKGMDQKMIEVALGTGMPVKISPKYWAEHLGLPYHQASIRELEMPRPPRPGEKLMLLSHGVRRFLRYGYGDLLREDRRYGILHRIWPGTQRLLLWGDPLTGAAYGRAFRFCGSDGVEIMEPLSFKGRRGSGLAGDRSGYADPSLRPRWDWGKYRYSYRLWGRLTYRPEADPEVWRRALRHPFRDGAEAVEQALAHASRILPTVTTAHAPSAGNNTYWPEVYTNQPIVDPERTHPYRDTPAPRVFGNVSPLDPQLFSRIHDFAGELLEGERSGKYSPVEVAQWLEDLAGEAAARLEEATARVPDPTHPEFRRLAVDVGIQIGLGRFFAAKLRSGVLYALHERTRHRTALEEALKAYRTARAAWAELAEQARQVYVPDLTVGERPHLRGHWWDRLPALDEDLEDMRLRLAQVEESGAGDPKVQEAVREALGRPLRHEVPCRHTPPARFQPGQPVEITLSVPEESPGLRVSLYYRRVNQSEHYRTAPMKGKDGVFQATLPSDDTRSPYPLQYYFELKRDPKNAWLYPGLGAQRTQQPYFLLRSSSRETSSWIDDESRKGRQRKRPQRHGPAKETVPLAESD